MITTDKITFKEEIKIGAILGVDVGAKRTGLAVSAQDLSIASGLTVIETGKISEILPKVIAEYKIRAIVIGWPLLMDGSESDSCKLIMKIAEKIAKLTALNILLFDERFTSKIAQNQLRNQNMSRKKRDVQDNSAAAQIILSDAIEYLRKE